MSPEELMSPIPVISIAHLTEGEASRSPRTWPTTTFEHPDYGYIVHIGSFSYCWKAAEVSPYHAGPEDWPGLMAVAAWAEGRGYDWVRFDRDADTVPGLPRWEW